MGSRARTWVTTLLKQTVGMKVTWLPLGRWEVACFYPSLDCRRFIQSFKNMLLYSADINHLGLPQTPQEKGTVLLRLLSLPVPAPCSRVPRPLLNNWLHIWEFSWPSQIWYFSRTTHRPQEMSLLIDLPRMQIWTSHKTPIGWDLGGSQMQSSCVFFISSLYRIRMYPGTLIHSPTIWTSESRVFIGISLCSHDWLYHQPVVWILSSASLLSLEVRNLGWYHVAQSTNLKLHGWHFWNGQLPPWSHLVAHHESPQQHQLRCGPPTIFWWDGRCPNFCACCHCPQGEE